MIIGKLLSKQAITPSSFRICIKNVLMSHDKIIQFTTVIKCN